MKNIEKHRQGWLSPNNCIICDDNMCPKTSVLHCFEKKTIPIASPNGTSFCKWSSGWTSLLQMIIQIGQHFANDHLDFFLSTRFFSFFSLFSANFLFSSKKHLLLHNISCSPSNLSQGSMLWSYVIDYWNKKHIYSSV